MEGEYLEEAALLALCATIVMTGLSFAAHLRQTYCVEVQKNMLRITAMGFVYAILMYPESKTLSGELVLVALRSLYEGYAIICFMALMVNCLRSEDEIIFTQPLFRTVGQAFIGKGHEGLGTLFRLAALFCLIVAMLSLLNLYHNMSSHENLKTLHIEATFLLIKGYVFAILVEELVFSKIHTNHSTELYRLIAMLECLLYVCLSLIIMWPRAGLKALDYTLTQKRNLLCSFLLFFNVFPPKISKCVLHPSSDGSAPGTTV